MVQVVNFLLRGWIKNLESDGRISLPLLEDAESTQSVERELEFVREGVQKSVKVRFYGSGSSLWDQMRSNLKHGFRKLKFKSN